MKKFYCPLVLLLLSALLGGTTIKAQTFTIFDVSDAPADDFENDALGGIETGVKFRVSQGGTVSAIRFYSRGSAAENQTYTGNLWDITVGGGSPVATGTLNVVAATGPGWKQISLSSSYHIVAGHTYVASMYSPNGNYVISLLADPGAFDDEDVIQPPFTIIGFASSAADPANPGNGLYRYGTSGEPNQTFNGSNYYVDLVFTTDFTLPIVLSELKATTSSNNIQLTWKTASEFNNRGFEIQRSNNGADWFSIGFVEGAGQSTILRGYNYADKGLAPGVYYYRLKQSDFDGKSTISLVVSATIGGKGVVGLSFPNPANGGSPIRFDLPRAQKIKLSLLDITGREIKVLVDGTSAAGSNLVPLNAASLQHQLYLLRLQSEDGTVTKKILIQ